METTAVTAIIGLLSLIVGGIFAFCREVVKAAHSDRDWWRDKGFVILQSQQETLEAQVKRDEERDEKIAEVLRGLHHLENLEHLKSPEGLGNGEEDGS